MRVVVKYRHEDKIISPSITDNYNLSIIRTNIFVLLFHFEFLDRNSKKRKKSS